MKRGVYVVDANKLYSGTALIILKVMDKYVFFRYAHWPPNIAPHKSERSIMEQTIKVFNYKFVKPKKVCTL